MLQILPAPSTTAPNQSFNLDGTIDVESIAALETLYVLPEHCTVELDFSLVLRVNSMGLAQLLKLFEHWQKRETTIYVSNTNRMIGVLFKMTGLTRFLAAEKTKAPVATSTEPAYQMDQAAYSGTAKSDGKLKMWVNAQSSHQMNGWYFFNTYLQRHLNREIQLELVHGAINEQDKHIHEMDIVFTKPFEATRLLLEHRFRPLLRPIDQTDEVTLLVRADDSRQSIADFQGSKVVTAAPDNFVYLLGRFLLEEEKESSSAANLDYLFSGHDIKALQMLLKSSADILCMLSETYESLSGLTKKMLRKVEQSETAFAFHLFCVAPHCAELGNAITEVLLNMSQDSQGRQVLADLNISGWSKPKQDEINMLVMLFNRYTASGEMPVNDKLIAA
jgi:ABC-type transporter Mla MlaB component